MSRQYFAIQLEFTHGFYGYINIVAVGEKCWEKKLIFIWISGQVGVWPGEEVIMGIIINKIKIGQNNFRTT